MSVKEVLTPLKDVFDPMLDTAVAPSLGKVYGYIMGEYSPETQADQLMLKLYSDPDKFFSVTYITEGMENVFNEVLDALEKGSKGPIVLPSLFGGGKTHTLLALLHAFKKPKALLKAEPRDVVNELYERVIKVLKKSGHVDIVVIDGDYEKYAPSPDKPLRVGAYSVHSIWGYIGHCLGRYDAVREYDVEFKAPSKDSLERMFEGKCAIVLADEILSGYALNLDDIQRGRFLEFFRRLAGAIQGKRVAVILTIPVRYQVERRPVEVEEQYKVIEDFIRGVFEALREQAMIIPPVRLEISGGVSEVVRILRKRIFGSALVKIPEDVLAHYQGIYSLEMFPPAARDVDTLRDSYPFHPTYIDTLLRHISERRPRLFQRTRFAILITRKAIRKLWKSNRNPDVIHVWNIDLKDTDISETIIGKLRDVEKDYKVYLNKLYEVAERSSEPIIAKDIVTSIFLRTFLYEGAPEALRAYPMEDEIYWMVYDRDYGIEPARLQKVLEELLENPDASYIARYEEEGKVYFTTLIDIIDILRRRKEEALRRKINEIYEKLKDELENILVAKDEEHEPFSKDMVIFLTSEDLIAGYRPEESSLHRVIIYLGSLKEEQARNLILGYRDYRNTTVVLDAKDRDSLDELLDVVGWLYVIDNLVKKKELEKIYKDKDVRKLNESKLREVKRGKTDFFKKYAPSVFRRIWYPAGEKVLSVDTTPKKSLLGNVHTALESIGVDKLLRPEGVDLEAFLKKLTEVGANLEKDWLQISKLVDLFLRNPRLWMADRATVLKVLKRLYDNLELAVMREGRIYWKNICETEEACSGGSHSIITKHEDFSDTDLVAHSKLAFTKFIEQLLGEEGEVREPDRIVRKYYDVLTDEGTFRLRDFYNVYKERLYLILKNPRNKLIQRREVIEKGFDLRIEPNYLETKPNEHIEVKVYIEPIGEFREEVDIKVDKGSVDPSKKAPPFEAIWKFSAEPTEGIYTYKIKALHDKLSRETTLTVKVFGEYEPIVRDLSDYEPMPGDVIEEASDIESVGTLQNIVERLGGLIEATSNVYMEASGYNGKLKITISGINMDDVKDIINGIKSLKDLNVNARVVFQNAKPLDELKTRRLNAIKLYLTGVKVKVRRKRT